MNFKLKFVEKVLSSSSTSNLCKHLRTEKKRPLLWISVVSRISTLPHAELCSMWMTSAWKTQKPCAQEPGSVFRLQTSACKPPLLWTETLSVTGIHPSGGWDPEEPLSARTCSCKWCSDTQQRKQGPAGNLQGGGPGAIAKEKWCCMGEWERGRGAEEQMKHGRIRKSPALGRCCSRQRLLTLPPPCSSPFSTAPPIYTHTHTPDSFQ